MAESRLDPFAVFLCRAGSAEREGGRVANSEKPDGKEALCVALLSRIVVVVLCVISDVLLPDHHPDASVMRSPRQVPWWLRAFTRWDAARFLHIAEHGYDTEESYAFFPLLPLAATALAWPARALGCPPTAALLASGLVITNLSFVVSAWALFHLGAAKLGDRGRAMAAVRLYCLTPANVFMSSLYTESPYAACSFGGLLLLEGGRPVGATLLLACATALRSNGLLNGGFFLHCALLQCCRTARRWEGLARLGAAAVCCAAIALPYVALQAYAFARECYAGDAPAWCRRRLPSVYSHVQAHYWQVGFLQYFQWRQIPNFLLAAPAVCIATWGVCRYIGGVAEDWRRRRADGKWDSRAAVAAWPLLPHVVHWGALTAFICLCANVQIVTRVTSAACPMHHWFVSSLLAQYKGGVVAQLLWSHIILWNVLGVIMHPNFLPWT
mmetsp:Transcript_117029/g.342764  ORF Transcript_117029/g.342764 Transcript_117029/m.342764 type:complete len:440 (+) Transcript_117029:82-1401(+)